VDEYFAHLELDLSKKPFNKAQLYRRISEKIGRTPSSVEFKFHNISAVLDECGLDWISGLAPLRNFQKMLADVISEKRDRIENIELIETPNGFEDLASLYFEAPPERSQEQADLPEFMKRLVRKFDPIARELRMKTIGDAGEQLIFEYEKRFLFGNDRADLSKNVRWVSKEEGDGAGYDILSFDMRGKEKFIEVKTTVGGNRTPFFISRNEHEFALEKSANFHLYRVFNFRKGPRAFQLAGPLENYVRLSTETFRADFNA
jgi:Protein NO VEIN, C-terminal